MNFEQAKAAYAAMPRNTQLVVNSRLTEILLANRAAWDHLPIDQRLGAARAAYVEAVAERIARAA